MSDTGKYNGRFSGRQLGAAGGRFGGRCFHILKKRGNPYGFIPEFEEWYARTSQTMPTGYQIAFNAAFVKARDAGLLADGDVFYLFPTHNEADARINAIKNAHTATAHGSPLFTAGSGFKGNGVSAYLNTHYDPDDEHVNYQLNDASMALYIYEPHSIYSYRFACGSYSGASELLWMGATADSYEGVNGSSFYSLGLSSQIGAKSVSMKDGLLSLRYNASKYNYTTSPQALPLWNVHIFGLNYGNAETQLLTNLGASSFYLGKSFDDDKHLAFKELNEDLLSAIAAL